jgi:hypothetical protein
MEYTFELTDTYAGESNYSWVQRARVGVADGTSRLALVRRAKAWAGFTGRRCRVEDYGDQLTIRPAGICQVLFVMLDN